MAFVFPFGPLLAPLRQLRNSRVHVALMNAPAHLRTLRGALSDSERGLDRSARSGVGVAGQVEATVRTVFLTAIVVVCLGLPQATALDLFGLNLFGGSDSADADRPGLKYDVKFEISPANAIVEERLAGASTLHNLMDRPPPDGTALRARADADIPRLVAALFAEGYYGGTIDMFIAGRPLGAIAPGTRLGGSGKPVPVVVRVSTGPQFVFGRTVIRQPSGAAKAPSGDPAAYGIVRGEPARSGVVFAAEKKIVRAWRESGYPLAEIADRKVVADHPSQRLDVTLIVRPHRRATFGTVSLEGTEHMDPEFTVRQAGIEPGSDYTPVTVEDARDRLRRLNVFSSVRIVEARALAKGDRLPTTIKVAERKRRIIGANAGWSSVDGGEIEAYWGHRNLFGRAEQLRVEGAVGQFGGGPVDELKYRAGVTFLKPGIFDIETDLFADLTFLREHPDAYESQSATAKVGLTRRFTKQLTGSIAGEVEVAKTDDAFGTERYTLLGIPVTLTYDSRDGPLDPTTGIFGKLLVEPFYEINNENFLLLGRADLAAYQKLDEPGRFVAAGRIAVGSFYSPLLSDIPADRRFYAGGGGSIRGYAYRNVGPRRGGEVVGGRSLVETSAELRARVTDTIGIVPFVDAGLVSEEPVPSSDVKFQVGVGIGVRYYTAIGPIRVDFAVPLDPEEDDPDIAFYAGLGQAF